MIKLIASDMDGTLLDDHMNISKENVTAIKEVEATGVEFLIATGRARKEALPIAQKAGIKTDFINLNGAMVYNSEGKVVVKHAIDLEKARQVAQLLHNAGFYYEIITADEVYSDNKMARIESIAELLVDRNYLMGFQRAVAIAAGTPFIMRIKFVPSLLALLEDPKIEVMKIIAFDRRGPAAFTDIKKAVADLGGLVTTSSSSNNIEINSDKAQKGLALLDYAKIRGIKPAEIAAIGDNLNDASMIKAAGLGIAMKNAIPAIKELANWVTKSNLDNGVAYALDYIMELNKKEKQ